MTCFRLPFSLSLCVCRVGCDVVGVGPMVGPDGGGGNLTIWYDAVNYPY